MRTWTYSNHSLSNSATLNLCYSRWKMMLSSRTSYSNYSTSLAYQFLDWNSTLKRTLFVNFLWNCSNQAGQMQWTWMDFKIFSNISFNYLPNQTKWIQPEFTPHWQQSLSQPTRNFIITFLLRISHSSMPKNEKIKQLKSLATKACGGHLKRSIAFTGEDNRLTPECQFSILIFAFDEVFFK